ncbi:hypothetical protein DEM25_011520 [Oceaniradius stylonematis]|jgi:hypothetical protein|uniref:DUF945 family protein n=2 Tax=Oceaniradius stylonematis TaxID=2184161 RepID=A0A3A8AF30_9HYPH|nr:hypothetical protein DEM25_011520 [Oceaniradius stylonematis]
MKDKPMIFSRPLLSASAIALTMTAFAPPALADIDGADVFEQLATQFALQGIKLEAAGVQTNGDDVAIAGLKMRATPETDPFPLGDYVLENVTEADGGSYLVDRIAIAPISQTTDGVTVEFEGGEINDYLIAGPQVSDPILRSGLFESAQAGALTISDAEGTIFSMEGASTTMDGYEPGGVMTFDANVDGMVADMTKLPEAQARETMAALGYEELRGTVTSKGSWDTGTGRLALDEMIYDVDDAASLEMTFDIGGYTPELVGAMQQMQLQMAEQNSEAMNMAMLGLMQQIEINAISIEIRDDSLTNRILDFVGEQQGMNRANVIAMAKGVLPIGLAQLQDPAFAAEATAAIGQFLDDPGTLRIAAEPTSAVPVAQIMAVAMSAPQALISTLAVSITANR